MNGKEYMIESFNVTRIQNNDITSCVWSYSNVNQVCNQVLHHLALHFVGTNSFHGIQFRQSMPCKFHINLKEFLCWAKPMICFVMDGDGRQIETRGLPV